MSTLRVSNLQDTSGGNSSTPAAIANGIAKAWVNFNGASTVSVRASYNVSSITDNGIGDYTVNFTNALADANYSVIAIPSRSGDTTTSGAHSFLPSTYATSSVKLLSSRGTGSATDPDFCNVAIFR